MIEKNTVPHEQAKKSAYPEFRLPRTAEHSERMTVPHHILVVVDVRSAQREKDMRRGSVRRAFRKWVLRNTRAESQKDR